MTDRLDIYGGLDPRDVPTYRVSEAARYLSLPVSTLRAWTFGQKSGTRSFHRVIEPADRRAGLLSFRNLVEAHVLSSLRVHHRIPLPRIRHDVAVLAQLTGKKRPLSDLPLMTDGADLFIRAFGRGILNVRREQFAIEEVVSAYLQRIESDNLGAISLYPFTRKRDAIEAKALMADPRIVVIDPRISFGRPVLAKSNIRTAVIAQRYLAGESVVSLAADYGRSALEIEEAIRSEIPVAA